MKTLFRFLPFLLLCVLLSLCLTAPACADADGFVIPPNTRRIEAQAFAGDTAMTAVTIPYAVTEIGNGAFSGCTNLTDVFYCGSAATWEKISFSDDNDALTGAELHYLIPVTEVFFPDAKFRGIVSDECDKNSDGLLSEAEIAEVAEIDCSGAGIADLTGIGYFTALTTLDCSGNSLTSLNLSANTELTTLDCSNNSLTSLNLSANIALTTLDCYLNDLETLILGEKTALTTLDCSGNSLTSLDISSCNALVSHLREATVSTVTGVLYYSTDDDITFLILDKGVHLTPMPIDSPHFPDRYFRNYVWDNYDIAGGDGEKDGLLSAAEIADRTAIDCSSCRMIADLTGIEHFTALTTLDCGGNSLTTLDLSANTALTTLDCSNNSLTSLNLSANTALTTLVCRDNCLTSLNLSANIALTTLNCYLNDLETLNLNANTALTTLDCSFNDLTSLDISSCNALVSRLREATVSTVTGALYYRSAENETFLVLDKGVHLTPMPIDEAHFPDANFRSYVSENCDIAGSDGSKDGLLSAAEIAEVEPINCNSSNIADLTGIEYFTALTNLNCSGNALSSLDLSANIALTTLICYSNDLETLDLSANTALTTLDCSRNSLTSLNLSANTALTELKCAGIGLRFLDLSGCDALVSRLQNASIVTNPGLLIYTDNEGDFLTCDEYMYLFWLPQ